MKLMKAFLLVVLFLFGSSVTYGVDSIAKPISVNLTPVYITPKQRTTSASIPYEGLGNVSIKKGSPELERLTQSLDKVNSRDYDRHQWDEKVELTTEQANQEKSITDQRLSRLRPLVPYHIPECDFKKNNHTLHRLIYRPDADKVITLFYYYLNGTPFFTKAALVAARMATLQKVVPPELCRVGNSSIRRILNNFDYRIPSSTDDFIQLFTDLAVHNAYKDKLSFENLTTVALLIWKVVGKTYAQNNPDKKYLEQNPIVNRILVQQQAKVNVIIPIISRLMWEAKERGSEYALKLESTIEKTIMACGTPPIFNDVTFDEFTSSLIRPDTTQEQKQLKGDQIPDKMKSSFKCLSGRDGVYFTLEVALTLFNGKTNLLTLFANTIDSQDKENPLMQKIREEKQNADIAYKNLEYFHGLRIPLKLDKNVVITWEQVEAAHKKHMEEHKKFMEEHEMHMKAYGEIKWYKTSGISPLTDALKPESKTEKCCPLSDKS